MTRFDSCCPSFVNKLKVLAGMKVDTLTVVHLHRCKSLEYLKLPAGEG